MSPNANRQTGKNEFQGQQSLFTYLFFFKRGQMNLKANSVYLVEPF